MLARLAYFFKQAIQNMAQNRWVHLVGLGITTIAILILGAFLLLFVNVDNWLRDWGASVTMSVYLEDELTPSQITKVRGALLSEKGVEIRRFISKDQALKELKKALGPQSDLLEGLSENPLPASFEIAIKEPQKDPLVVKEGLERIPGVSEVQYSEAWIQRFEDFVRVVRIVGAVAGVLLCVGVLFIVTNTIKLTIYSRKEEIHILKLVGATDWFVKLPFLIEGLMQGAIGGAAAMLALFAIYVALSANKALFLGFVLLDIVFIPVSYVAGIMLLNTILGVLGSLMAIGGFLEV